MFTECHTPDQQSSVLQDFCNDAINTMIRYYGVTKADFERMSQEGYTKIEFGRGPLAYCDRRTGHYIVSFAAFVKEGLPEIKTLEVIKKAEAFGSVSLGLFKGSYSPEDFQAVVDKYRILLTSENLAGFIQRLE